MALVRLEEVDTDMIISLNIPIEVAATSSEAKTGASIAVNLEEQEKLRALLLSIRVTDWQLFSSS